VSEWCVTLEKGTELKLPWRLLRGRIAELDPSTGFVKYQTTFEEAPTTLLEVMNMILGLQRLFMSLFGLLQE